MSYLHPSAKLLVKLGSLVVHADEALSPDAHDYDRLAFRQLLEDPDVKEWIKGMAGMALLPVKRKT